MHLSGTADLGLIILKGHLLLEEQLKIIISERMKKPEALELYTSKWGFNQVVCLTEALCSGEVQDDLWKCLRKLNRLRNDMAHQLEPKGLEDRIHDLKMSWPYGPGEENDDDDHWLYLNLFSMVIMLSGLARKPSSKVAQLIQS